MAQRDDRQFCIYLTPEQGNYTTKAALLRAAKWDEGAILRVTFLEGDASLQARVQAAAEGWLYDQQAKQRLANLTLDFVTEGEADIRIAFEQGAGSWSYLGTFCRQIDPSEPTMNFGWLTPDSSDEDVQGVVLHEFGHALGLIHEHQNPNDAIQWNEAAVIADLSGPPNNWDLDKIRHNVLDRVDPETVDATAVDPLSIMMYRIPAAWTNGTFSSGENSALSVQDKTFIRGQYP